MEGIPQFLGVQLRIEAEEEQEKREKQKLMTDGDDEVAALSDKAKSLTLKPRRKRGKRGKGNRFATAGEQTESTIGEEKDKCGKHDAAVPRSTKSKTPAHIARDKRHQKARKMKEKQRKADARATTTKAQTEDKVKAEKQEDGDNDNGNDEDDDEEDDDYEGGVKLDHVWQD